MNITTRLSNATAPFAHLLGLGPRAGTDDKRRSKRADEDDEEKKDARSEEKDTTDQEEDTGRSASKAEDEDADDEEIEDGEEEEEEDEDNRDDKDERESRRSKKGKKSKKSKRAEEDEDAGVDGKRDDSDEDMRGQSAAAHARRRERARCEAIFACDAAAVRPDVAAQVAFRTTLARGEAVSVVTAAAAAGHAPRGSRLADRMETVKTKQVGPENRAKAPDNLSPVAAAIIAAGERARGH